MTSRPWRITFLVEECIAHTFGRVAIGSSSTVFREFDMRRKACVFLASLVLLFFGWSTTAQKRDKPPEEKERAFTLEQNYPNPFNPDTKIPFVLKDQLFEEGKPVVVSVRIFNILQQQVAVPTALKHERGENVRVLNLEYRTPGRHESYWNGLDVNGDPVASGVYFMQLTVRGEGKSPVKKMFVTK